MIHYDLQCGAEHRFDGWFKDSASFEKQAARGLLECPICGDTGVQRALMTPSVPKKGRDRMPAPAQPPANPPPAPLAAPVAVAPVAPVAVTGPRMPDQVRAMLMRMRQEVERKCDYVGPEFADEARRIHNGETTPRSIYGEASSDDVEALAEDGIEVARIPWIPRADG
jgi:hypothetical protein